MSRPESTINGIGPVADFAQQLRLLRQHAALSLRQLAASTGLSTATLSVAAAGRKLPTWEVTKTYVQACGGDANAWRGRWEYAGQSSRLVPATVPNGRVSRVASGRPWGTNVRLLGGPAPLPVTAETACEFMDCLLWVKIWAGDPSVRALSQRAGLPPSAPSQRLLMSSLVAGWTICHGRSRAHGGDSGGRPGGAAAAGEE